MTNITYEERPMRTFRSFILNREDISPLGQTMIDGADSAVFNGQFIDIYKGNTRVYQFGFTYYEESDWYGREGVELIG